MKISTKGRYGLTIMIDLARHNGLGPKPLKAIAQNNGLSENYLEQLAAQLKNASLIKSVRGAYGGYYLSKQPNEITAGDIIRVLEGPITLVEGIEDEEPAQQALWMRVSDAVRGVLDETTLEELIQYDNQGQQDSYMFYI